VDVEKIVELVRSKAGTSPEPVDDVRLAPLGRFLENQDVREYLSRCLAKRGYVASGVNVKAFSELLDENIGEASPGRYIGPYGYLVIATSIGGNAICLHSPSGRVFWVDHSSIYDGGVSFQNKLTGEWTDLPISAENVGAALKPLAEQLEPFLVRLLGDDLLSDLELLDH
jgi:hypothetical protein